MKLPGENQPSDWTPEEVEHQTRLQYGGGKNEEEEIFPFNADARRELYKYARDGRNVWKEIEEKLQLKGNESILDVGTSRAAFLEQLLLAGHSGDMLGIDINERVRSTQAEIFDELGSGSQIALEIGDAEDLQHIPDESCQVACGLFIGYHLPNPWLAVTELYRVIKKGGKVAFATRDEENLHRLWEFGALIADRIGAPRPRTFYSHFNIAESEQALRKAGFIIRKNDIGIQDSPIDIHITSEDWRKNEEWGDYRNALFSLIPDMIKEPDTLLPPKSGPVREIIDGEIWEIVKDEARKNNGIFSDRVKQGYFIGRKPNHRPRARLNWLAR